MGFSSCSLSFPPQFEFTLFKSPLVVIAVGFRYMEEAHDRTPSGCADPDVAEWNQKVGFFSFHNLCHTIVVENEHICHSLMSESCLCSAVSTGRVLNCLHLLQWPLWRKSKPDSHPWCHQLICSCWTVQEEVSAKGQAAEQKHFRVLFITSFCNMYLL